MPAPPSIVSLTTPAGSVVAVMLSLPPRPLMTSESFAPFGVGDVHLSRQSPTTEAEVPAPNTSMMSSPFVPLTITVSACAVAGGAADRAGEIDVDLGHVGAG